MSELADRLASPSRRVTVEELAATWAEVRIVARIEGYGGFAGDMRLLRRIRGALGQVLMEGASPEAVAGRPCPWRPPCALDVMFREQLRVAQNGLPKPYVLAALRRGEDLEVVLTLFGLAIDWAAAMTHALAAALRHRIDWADQDARHFVPKLAAVDIRLFEVTGVAMPPPRRCVELAFLTPMNAEHDDPADRPATVVARLARRIEGLARWQDAVLEADWLMLAEDWNACAYDCRDLRAATVARRSGRSGRDFAMPAVCGALTIAEVPAALWPFLVIGQHTHVGKGAAEGFGRFSLT
jgi:hypothetical protein